MLLQVAVQDIGQLTDIEGRRTLTKTGIVHIVAFLNAELFAMFGLPHDYDSAAIPGNPAGLYR
jgi:hypothetical protein